MKITSIKPICLRYKYDQPIYDGCNTCEKREAFLILVETDSEITGIGEAATFGTPLSALKEVLEHSIAPLLIGEDPLKIEFLWEKLLWSNYAGGRKGLVRGVASGVDIALWDIMGKACKMPLYKLLGANSNKVQSYASAGFYSQNKSIDDLEREMESLSNYGYQAFKMKVGRTEENVSRILRYMPKQDNLYQVEDDMKRIEAVRKVIGNSSKLMLDMNNTWNVEQVCNSVEFMKSMNIYSIEEPIQNGSTKDYQHLSNQLQGILLAGGENEQGIEKYHHMLDQDTLDIVQSNIGWSGGITEARKIGLLCALYNKMFSPHSFFSAVLIAANVHLSASLSNVPFIESEENENPLRSKLIKELFPRDESMAFVLTDKPGLGIDLDWEAINEYQIK
ncbi:mandelate racemase/muconate lactonizing enzyme family protein [Enterococcus hulanensis]|uniref:mandelate racemase/muconate lactonizing enzyme family protein n=1 Tax=Enterococcus hulanensis TaxID=2559929 RepID=UPI001A8EA7FF|nr:mandelate racemase/muconate lactonizing enzyme family protein [Enterococcus hulanensis]MBO0456001.1 mandelate racemase/muconate lactonizing enzyme family protein [Enterococcus hulanensis]